MRAPAIVASVLGADYARLGRGISAATAPGAVRAGAQLLVAGPAILNHLEGRPAAVAELRRSLQPDVEALRE